MHRTRLLSKLFKFGELVIVPNSQPAAADTLDLRNMNIYSDRPQNTVIASELCVRCATSNPHLLVPGCRC